MGYKTNTNEAIVFVKGADGVITPNKTLLTYTKASNDESIAVNVADTTVILQVKDIKKVIGIK